MITLTLFKILYGQDSDSKYLTSDNVFKGVKGSKVTLF